MNIMPPLLAGFLTFRVECAHVSGFQGTVGTHLNLMFQHRVRETIKEELIDGHIESGDDFL